MAAPALDTRTGGLKSKEFVIRELYKKGSKGSFNLPAFQADQNFNIVQDFKVVAQIIDIDSAKVNKTNINNLPIDVSVKTATVIITQDMPIQMCNPQVNQNQDYRIWVSSPTRTPISIGVNIGETLTEDVVLYFIFKLV